MTELQIDGVQVVLPADMNLTVKRENPIFTKNGEYTYDLTLKLTNPVNAELYKHINRKNKVTRIETKRSAILRADNRVYCNGTEIITGWTDDSIIIQITSGNSELNYFIGGDRLIDTLDMGVADLSNPKTYVEKIYPEVDFSLFPVILSNNEVLNDWKVHIKAAFPSTWPDGKRYPEIDGIDEFACTMYAQPYLCSYIEKLINSLGYEIVSNELAKSEWKTLCLVQSSHPTQYSQMFRGWTVEHFLTEIENKFNLQFITDNNKKEVRILFKNTFYQNQRQVSIRQVIDTYECEIEEDEADVSNSNILINAPDTEYYRKQYLTAGLIESATRKELPDLLSVYNYIQANGFEMTKNILFFTTSNQRYYITNESSRITMQPAVEVNMFGDYIRNGIESNVEINMVAADYAETCPKGRYDASSSGWSYTIDKELTSIELPRLSSEIAVQESTDKSLFEQITGEERSSGGSKSNNLMITFYQGLRDIFVMPKVLKNIGGGSLETGPFDLMVVKYPFPFNARESGGFHGNMRTTYLNEQLYSGAYQIDVAEAIKMTSYDPNIYDARLVFEIHNKRYVCKEMEFILTPEGRKKAWTGIFYPIHISDTEADKRWVLTDGKWRDGGAWIDTGRWLDE